MAEAPNDPPLPLSPGAFVDLRLLGGGISDVAGIFSEWLNINEADGVSRVHGLFVSGDLFSLLGREAALGRTLRSEDERDGSAPVVMISHGYWQRKFGGEASVIGRTLEFGGRTRQVVGVMPADFRFSESLNATDGRLSASVEIWVPFDVSANRHERGIHFLTTIGRLAPETGLAAAQEEMNAYAANAGERFPDTDLKYGLRVISLSDQVVGHLRPVLLTLWAATGLVVLIAGANLATLFLARAQKRQRDLALRFALGSSRSRVMSGFLVEAITLSVAGGLLSLAIAFVATKLLAAKSPVSVFQSYPPRIELHVVGVTLAVAVLVGLVLGAVAASWACRVNVARGLHEGAARVTGRSRWVFAVLVAAQIAFATALLIAMGLSLRSFRQLLRADLGVEIQGVLTMDLFLPRSLYRDPARRASFYNEVLESTRALAGAESVGMSSALPLSGVDPSNGLGIEGRQFDESAEPSANLSLVDAEYFNTMGIDLLRGRGFLASDTLAAPHVAVIDQRLVDLYFAGEDPLGRRISIADEELLTVVGVVTGVDQAVFERTHRPCVYLPITQRSHTFTSLVIRTGLEQPLSMAPAVRAAIRGLDKSISISDVSTLNDSLRTSISPQRFSLLLIVIFAAISLLLMQIGTYGVMAYLAGQRQQEVGVRLALGARPNQVLWLLFRQGLVLSLAGTAVGVVIAAAAGKLLASLVYGIETLDLLVFGSVSMLSLLAAFIAYWHPALSLSRVAPTASLQAH